VPGEDEGHVSWGAGRAPDTPVCCRGPDTEDAALVVRPWVFDFGDGAGVCSSAEEEDACVESELDGFAEVGDGLVVLLGFFDCPGQGDYVDLLVDGCCVGLDMLLVDCVWGDGEEGVL
jgi:hypothetical protein